MGESKGAQRMPKVDDTNESMVYKAPPRRLRMARQPTPPPTSRRPPPQPKKSSSKA